MKLFLVSSVFLVLSTMAFADVSYNLDGSDDAKMTVSDKQILGAVESNALKGRNVNLERFSINYMITPAGDDCRKSGSVEARTALEYSVGQESHVVNHTVCVSQKGDAPFLLGKVEQSDKIVKTFDYAVPGVNDDGGVCGINEERQQQTCLSGSYRIYSKEITNIIKTAESHLISATIDPAHPNCVTVSYFMGGKGKSRIEINGNWTEVPGCAGGSYFKYTLIVKADK